MWGGALGKAGDQWLAACMHGASKTRLPRRLTLGQSEYDAYVHMFLHSNVIVSARLTCSHDWTSSRSAESPSDPYTCVAQGGEGEISLVCGCKEEFLRGGGRNSLNS